MDLRKRLLWDAAGRMTVTMSDDLLPLGFRWAGVTAGLKKSGLSDLALVTTDAPAVAAGVYTQNVIRAASIDWNRAITPTAHFRGLVINSGNANACTGEQGIADNRAMAGSLTEPLSAAVDQILVLSTGVIGHLLPMPKVVAGIEKGVRNLGRSFVHFEAASQAIMTTDRFRKTALSSFEVDGQTIRIAAMAKGAGMIGPNMATMLAVMMTDAKLTPGIAQAMLTRIATRSFNCISVEGHTSTNDALLLIASGNVSSRIERNNFDSEHRASPAFVENRLESEAMEEKVLALLEAQLTRVAVELATKIPADGEGATHLINIRVSGAASDAEADRMARSIANSPLVKTAILGGDPNWGRIVSAAGYCGVAFNPAEVSLHLNAFELFRAGTPLPFEASTVSQSIKSNFETEIDLRVGEGRGSAQHWTSDLTIDYVKFNSEYTT
jgi:glutamate N-acetyltransferase / amino-acid N-acetyltransferase